MALDIRIRFGRAIRRIREEQEINQEEAATPLQLSSAKAIEAPGDPLQERAVEDAHRECFVSINLLC
jgi:hypothetical protein